MVSLIRCDSSDKDFMNLAGQLDQDLNNRYGEIQLCYNKYNVIQSIDTVVVAYVNNLPAGCGCFKKYDDKTVEIKRMFVKHENRGVGLSKQILAELEEWAAQLGYAKSILETGIGQTEAIGLYESSGYNRIKNFGQYAGISNSVCFGKALLVKEI